MGENSQTSHYPDIQMWTRERLENTLGALFESGFEIEQEPEDSRSLATQSCLQILYERHAECIAENNRRQQPHQKECPQCDCCLTSDGNCASQPWHLKDV
jgi:DNA-binding helix-hairpin-helix protein with protein kinase domain